MIVSLSGIVFAETENAVCEDSDGGKNLLVSGETQTGNSGQGDYCNYREGLGKIYEAYCEDETTSGQELMDCPTEAPYCNKGACSSTKPVCEENDGGKNKFILGTTIPSRMANHEGNTDYCQKTSTGEPMDRCSGSDCSVREFFCSGDWPDSFNNDIPCPAGCKEGVCQFDGSFEFTLQKGWNLVSGKILFNIEENLLDRYTSYYYSPNENKYQLYKGEFSTEHQDYMNNYINKDEMFSFWVFNDDNEERVYEVSEYNFNSKELDFVKLKKGWNFISVLNYEGLNILDLSPKDIQGSCNIDRGYLFDTVNNKWNILNSESGNFKIQMLGKGWVVKVSEDCNLGLESNFGVPPQIPSN